MDCHWCGVEPEDKARNMNSAIKKINKINNLSLSLAHWKKAVELRV
jgi:hypothetical protein